MAGIFGDFFLVSISHETKHENSSKNSGKIRREIRGKIRDKKIEKFGELSDCDFPDLRKWLTIFDFFDVAPFRCPLLWSTEESIAKPRKQHSGRRVTGLRGLGRLAQHCGSLREWSCFLMVIGNGDNLQVVEESQEDDVQGLDFKALTILFVIITFLV